MARGTLYKTAPVALLLSVLAVLAGCSHMAAKSKSRSQFEPTTGNAGVRYLPGSQALADTIAANLAPSVEIVEQFHGGKFTHAPTVLVCKSACFSGYAPGSNNDPATQYGDAIFINEDLILQREQQRGVPPAGFLVHELAHLLLYQRAGVIAYLRVPAWFKEGVAVVNSSGAALRS